MEGYWRTTKIKSTIIFIQNNLKLQHYFFCPFVETKDVVDSAMGSDEMEKEVDDLLDWIGGIEMDV